MRRAWWLIAGPLVALDWLLHKNPRPFGVARWRVCNAMEWAWERTRP